MNAIHSVRTPLAAPVRPAASSAAVRREHRVRDFGIGYGSSSGYGLSKRYTSDWGQARFRCA